MPTADIPCGRDPRRPRDDVTDRDGEDSWFEDSASPKGGTEIEYPAHFVSQGDARILERVSV